MGRKHGEGTVEHVDCGETAEYCKKIRWKEEDRRMSPEILGVSGSPTTAVAVHSAVQHLECDIRL